MNGKAIGACSHAPCLLKPRLAFSPFPLISSRQAAVWGGLKAFTEPSPALLNAHLLLEILDVTHHLLRLIRCWHP